MAACGDSTDPSAHPGSNRTSVARSEPAGAGRYAAAVEGLELFYTGMLVVSAIVITWFSGFVVWRLFKGQR